MPTSPLAHPDVFVRRHIGPSPEEQGKMLKAMGVATLEALVSETVPASIRMTKPLALPPGRTIYQVPIRRPAG